MIGAGKLPGPPDRRAGRRVRLVGVCLALGALSCRTETTTASSAAGANRGAGPYVCDGAHDYRVFETSATLAGVNAQVPRREQTKSQAESLTPGDPLWRFEDKPEIRCSSDGFLELRYAVPDPGGFASAPNRMTVTIAPGTRLLDPRAHARMKELAAALDEALTLLRTKPCSDRGEPCDLRRNQDPLRFPGARMQYAVNSEFKSVGRRAWSWQFAADGRQVLRVTFCTTDGRFDIEVLVETADTSGNGAGSLHLIPELLSHEYDRGGLRPDAATSGGGSHG